MPVTVSGTGLDTFIEGIKQRIESPEMIVALGKSLSGHLVESFGATGLASRSGSTIRALSAVGEPERTSTGWRIGVGDARKTGFPTDPSPKGTLRAFFLDNPEIKPSPWRRIPQSYKEKLEAMRRAGMYGGRGPDYANYMWVQDSGNATAHIPARGFVNMGLTAFRSEALQIIEDYLRR